MGGRYVGSQLSNVSRSQRELIEAAIHERRWAIVGASKKQQKFGNIIYRDLKRAGYQVVGVNPNAESAYGDPVYPTLADLPDVPGVVDTVVPLWVGRRIAKDVARLGVKLFWLQQGSRALY